MSSRSLLPHHAARGCAIGPFVVDYVFKQRALIVELERRDPKDATQSDAREAFLTGMGYRVVTLSRKEVRADPDKTLRRIRAALAVSP